MAGYNVDPGSRNEESLSVEAESSAAVGAGVVSKYRSDDLDGVIAGSFLGLASELCAVFGCCGMIRVDLDLLIRTASCACFHLLLCMPPSSLEALIGSTLVFLAFENKLQHKFNNRILDYIVFDNKIAISK